MIRSSKVSLRVGKLRGDFPPVDPKFRPNTCLTNIFLHCVFQSTFYVKQLKSFILGVPLLPEGTQILYEQLSHKHLPTLWVSTLYV